MDEPRTEDETRDLSLESLSAAYAASLRGHKAKAAANAGKASGFNDEGAVGGALEPMPESGPRNIELGRGPTEASNAESDAESDAENDAENDGYERTPITPAGILEALLFVGRPDNTPLTADQAAALMQGVAPEEIHELVRGLNSRYAEGGCPYEIQSEGAGYRLTLKAEFSRIRERYFGRMKAARLSQAAVDVLALVAYNQPITREAIDRLRDKQSASILAQLVRRRLLRIELSDARPPVKSYRTTDRFLQLLGMESLDDLPQSYELEPLGM